MAKAQQSGLKKIDQAARRRYHRALYQLSTLDGREVLMCEDLAPFLSEAALHRYRAIVMIEALIAFSESDLPGGPTLTPEEVLLLRSIVTEDAFDATAVADYDHFRRNGLGPFEHDVKAVEVYLRERLTSIKRRRLCEWVHFPMTSEDVNNLAWNLMLRNAVNQVWLPAVLSVTDGLARYAEGYADVPVLGITHGMKASPTTIGKRFSYTLEQISEVLARLKELPLTGKFGGPVGNHNAMTAVVPGFDIEAFARTFVERFGFVYTDNTHQRNSHQAIVRLLHEVKLLNEWLIDLCENIRHNVMLGWLYQEAGDESNVGSSVMPHKINPWFFEVAQGYLEQADRLIDGAVPGLLQSVFERDLTDHPWERAYGEMLGKSLIGVRYISQGLATLRVNEASALEALRTSPEVLSEAVQIAGRIADVPNIYMTIKLLTRGRVLDRALLQQIIDEQIPDAALRARLTVLSGETYTGRAALIAKRTVVRYRRLRRSVERGFFNPTRQIQAVLFDFDGTLHFGDKTELHCRLEEISLRLDLGFTDDELRAFGDRSDYREMSALMVQAFNAKATGRTIDDAEFQRVNKEVSGLFDEHFVLAPWARELLMTLRASGIKTALVTTRGSNSLPRLLKHHGIAHLFDVVVSRDDCHERKPHPQPIALALERLGIEDPSTAVYVGDKQVDDVIAGNALGLQTVLVNIEPLDRYGAQPTHHLSSLQPLLQRFTVPYWER